MFMIEGIIVKNGTTKLIVVGSDSIDQEVLKSLNGATCKVIQDNYRLGDKLITGGLIIELEKSTIKSNESNNQSTDGANTNS